MDILWVEGGGGRRGRESGFAWRGRGPARACHRNRLGVNPEHVKEGVPTHRASSAISGTSFEYFLFEVLLFDHVKLYKFNDGWIKIAN